jgi:hypothetical protein
LYDDHGAIIAIPGETLVWMAVVTGRINEGHLKTAHFLSKQSFLALFDFNFGRVRSRDTL